MKSLPLAIRRSAASIGGKLFRPGARSLHSLFIGTTVLLLGLPQRGSAENIAPQGKAILGVNDAIDADAGKPRFHVGVGANINDDNPSTRVDNWFGDSGTDNGQAVSFVGIIWPSLRYGQIRTLTLTMATFFDGGWFGKKAIGPGTGQPLTAAHLVEPSIQITTDHGTTWTSFSYTSDYMTVMNGHGIGGAPNPNPTSVTITFVLGAPATKVNGVRIIGENGGTADGNGFIGVFELAVDADPFVDTDADGMPDEWEQANGLNVGTNDASADPDADGLTNGQEYAGGTDPKKSDTDGDGLTDKDEIETQNTDPLKSDTDGDGYDDGFEVAQASDPNNATSLPNNFARSGTGILGTKTSLDSGPETEKVLFHAGTAGNINDESLITRVDTYNENGLDTVSFVGILWANPVAEPIGRLELTLATFFDGGWFGVNRAGPGSGGNLSADLHLTEPTVEITTDGGSTWTAVEHTSDYLTALNGHGIGGGTHPNPSSVTTVFNLMTPAVNINGIRIIGTEGGTASGGFLGVFELAVRTGSTDLDSDGMDDAWERQHGLNVGTNDSAADADGDGLSNLQEFTANTNPKAVDTDGDGLNDGLETNTHHTNPLKPDTDEDGLSDGSEITKYHTNPLVLDSDDDGFSDGLEVKEQSDPALASSFPSNIAPRGTGILGTKPDLESGPETEVAVFNAGRAAGINDGDPTTRVDTYNNTSQHTVSFVGILWSEPVTNPIVRLDLSLATFFDGGWFGENRLGPGAGGALSAADHLVEPLVEVTVDGGTTWAGVDFTSDYLVVGDGHPLPAVAVGAPTLLKTTFQLMVPQTGINGIRIIGTEGGTASGGFIGVFELETRLADATGPRPVTLEGVTNRSGQLQFEFDSQSGVSHIVQYKTVITDANWQTLSTVPGDGTRKQVTDPIGDPRRFYRVTSE